MFQGQHLKLSRNILTSPAVLSSKHVLEEMYTTDEQRRILECFNRCSSADFYQSKLMNNRKAITFVEYRQRHGEFQSLSDVLKVPGVGILSLEKLCSKLKTMDYDAVKVLKLTMEEKKYRPNPALPDFLSQVR